MVNVLNMESTIGYKADLRTCDLCGGTGAILDDDEDIPTGNVIACPQCGGEGCYL